MCISLVLLLSFAVAKDTTVTKNAQIVSLVAPETPDVYVGIAVLTEAYSRLGMMVVPEVMAGDLALRTSTSGGCDGEVHRIDGITHRFPTLHQIPVPINYIELAIYSKDPLFKPREWLDLGSRPVGIVRGILAAERATRGLMVREVDTYDELIKLLVQDDVQAIVAPRIEIDLALASGRSPQNIVLNAVLDTHLLYHYLHLDRIKLAEQIQPVLKSMLMEGEITLIRTRTYQHMLNKSAEEKLKHGHW